MRNFSILETVYASKAHHHGGERISSFFELRGENANNVELLEQVLLKLQARHPALRIRINFDGATMKWKQDDSLRIPVTTVSGDVMSTYFEMNNARLLTGEGICRILLVKGASDQESTLVPFMEHFTSDGVSYLNFCHELLLGMGGSEEFDKLMEEKLDYSPPSAKLGPRGYDGHFPKKVMSVARFLLKVPAGKTRTKRPKRKPTAEDLEQPQITLWDTLSEDTTSKLLKACKAHGTSLTGIVGACMSEMYARTLCDRDPDAKKTQYSVAQGLAYDLRRFYKPRLGPEHISFHAGVGVPIVLKVPGKEDNPMENTWENAVKYKQEITKHQKQQLPIGILLLIHLSPIGNLPQFLVRFLARSDSGKAEKDTAFPQDVMLTNWGRVPVQTDYNGLEVLSFAAGVNEVTTKHITIVLSSFRGKIGLTALASKKHYDESLVKEYLDRLFKRLEAIAEAQ